MLLLSIINSFTGGSGGGGGSSYDISILSDSIFAGGDEASFNRSLVSTSSFTAENDTRYGHYFKLNLSTNYYYTFETTAAFFGGDDDTEIYLYENQNLPFGDGTWIANNDDGGDGSLSRLAFMSLPSSSCLVVTSFYDVQPFTGPFTLNVKRVPKTINLTDLTDDLFENDEITLSKTITNTSPFVFPGVSPPSNRFGHYFTLHQLSANFAYTFEVTTSTFSPNLYVMNTQNLPVSFNDVEISEVSLIQGLNTNRNTWFLVVTSDANNVTGSFTLNIGRL